MQKPNGYDEARATGEFTPVNLGGHYCVIKQVSEKQSSTGKDMVVVLFDFAPEDEQAGYFADMFNNDTRDDKKWAFNGSKYIMVNDYQDPNKTSSQFKTFCSCVEKSNNMQIIWGSDSWAKQFIGKKIGVVYGEVEHEYDGKVSMRREPRWFRAYDSVKGARVPDPKYLPNKNKGPATTSDGFLNIPEGAEDEIPF